MNILVYDVAADGGGAATILSYYYRLHQQDKENHYYYLLSTYPLKDAENITVIHVPEVKKNWINRVLFDLQGAKKYMHNGTIFVSYEGGVYDIDGKLKSVRAGKRFRRLRLLMGVTLPA